MNSKLKTELEFLTAVERGEVVTQVALSQRVGVAVGLINALLKRAVHKGYVKVRGAPYKRYAYYLTPTGFAEKSRLVAEYLEVSLEFFREARRQYHELFVRAQQSGARRLMLVGSGELAEIAVMAAHEVDVELVAILDPETNRDHLYGLAVARSVRDVREPDAFVMTESRRPQETYAQLRSQISSPIFAPKLLKIIADVDMAVPTEPIP